MLEGGEGGLVCVCVCVCADFWGCLQEQKISAESIPAKPAALAENKEAGGIAALEQVPTRTHATYLSLGHILNRYSLVCICVCTFWLHIYTVWLHIYTYTFWLHIYTFWSDAL